MSEAHVSEELEWGVALGTAVLCLSGRAQEAALTRVACRVLGSRHAYFESHPDPHADTESARVPISPSAAYCLSGKKGCYNEADLDRLNQLAELTAHLFQRRREQDQRMQALLHDQARHQQILEQLHESVITMDLAGFILSWNRGAEHLFGYPASEVLGKNILFLYEEQDREDARIRDAFLEGGGREMEVRRRRKNGEIFWASLKLSSLKNAHGEAVGMIGFLSDITERKQAQEQIHHLAYYDTLTRLPNRSLFRQLLDNGLTQMQRNQSGGALLVLDMQRFKPVNDSFGRSVGDEILREVARRLRGHLRDNDLVARLGSDEFAIALFDTPNETQAMCVLHKLQDALSAPFFHAEQALRLGARFGISLFPADGAHADALLEHADVALSKAKHSKEHYAFYNPSMNAHMAARLRLESDMRQGVHRDEFFLAYQPKISLASGRMIGLEALIRWQHPQRGGISPAEFIPLAESSDLILQLGEWVLEQVCVQVARWRSVVAPDFRVAFNLSAREFDAELPCRLEAALKRHNLPGSYLEIELTESMLMRDTAEMIDIMSEITRQGVILSLDDFGTGYSSLAYLTRLPIHTLKIDRSFVQGVTRENSQAAIAKTIVSMAKELGHRVVAEGIETSAQLAFFSHIACDQAQGFLLSRPVRAEQIPALLDRDLRPPPFSASDAPGCSPSFKQV